MAILFAILFLAAFGPIVWLDAHGYKPEKREYKYCNCCECDCCECGCCEKGGGK